MAGGSKAGGLTAPKQVTWCTESRALKSITDAKAVRKPVSVEALTSARGWPFASSNVTEPFGEVDGAALSLSARAASRKEPREVR